MLTAKDIMAHEVITVTPATKIVEAAKLLLQHRINGLPVVDDSGRVVGVVCQSDLVAQQKRLPLPSVFNLLDGLIPLMSLRDYEHEVQKIAAVTVGQAMTPNPVTVSPATGLEEIASLMADKKLHTLPVVEAGKLVGVVGKEDVLRTLMPPPDR
jgi:CBS-domain-containing membrane protein